MASAIETIWTSIKTILTNDETLSSYVNKIYEGFREDVPYNKQYIIILDPVSETEEISQVPYQPKLTVTIYIYCVIIVEDVDKQILGSGTKKGIFEFVADVKNALAGNTDLLNSCNKFTMPSVNYLFWRSGQYPIRAGVIEINIEKWITKQGR